MASLGRAPQLQHTQDERSIHPRGWVQPRAATDGGKEITSLGNPLLMLPQITVPIFWESFNEGKRGGRTGWPPEDPVPLGLAPGKPEAQSSSQGWKTAEKKPCI